MSELPLSSSFYGSMTTVIFSARGPTLVVTIWRIDVRFVRLKSVLALNFFTSANSEGTWIVYGIEILKKCTITCRSIVIATYIYIITTLFEDILWILNVMPSKFRYPRNATEQRICSIVDLIEMIMIKWCCPNGRSNASFSLHIANTHF